MKCACGANRWAGPKGQKYCMSCCQSKSKSKEIFDKKAKQKYRDLLAGKNWKYQ